jgi:ferredoxin
VIRANRGDRLRLTFSTRDTAHSFFLEEHDMDVKISPGTQEVAVYRTSDPEVPPVHTREVILDTEPKGVLDYLFSKSRYRCHVWCGPMHAFEHGDLVVRPNTLLAMALGLLAGIPFLGLLIVRRALREPTASPPEVRQTDGIDLLRRFPGLKRLVKKRGFQYSLIAVASVVFYVVILTTLLGTHMSGRNLGVLLLWIVWLFVLAVLLTPFGGRAWCTVCPLPALGEVLQRGAVTGVRKSESGPSRFRSFGLNRVWPRWLSNYWPRLVLYLTLGTFSTLLVADPRVSGWVVLGLIALSTAMALVWEKRAFCRYVCPVTAFVGLYGRAGKLALRSADPEVCAECSVQTCLHGNSKGWPCPFGLCVADIHENTDCGMCTECIKSCAYDNVTFRWRPAALETRIKTFGESFLSIAMLTLAATYSIVHLGPWPAVRDYVNILDKGNWGLFGIFAAILWGASLIVLPGVLYALAGLGRVITRATEKTVEIFKASTAPLIPLGLGLWIAFVVPMLFVNFTFVIQSFSDPFGWGWDFFGTRSTPWHQLWPRWIPALQAACVLIGFAFGLRNAWRIWLGITGVPRLALRGMLPLAAFLVVFSGFFLFFFVD